MDLKTLSELLKGTLDPAHRNEAEKKLTEVHKVIGFGPVLLQVIMSTEVELPVRQAAVIYLKNMVSSHWSFLLHYCALIGRDVTIVMIRQLSYAIKNKLKAP